MSNIFLRKIAKMFTINFILREIRFFVNVLQKNEKRCSTVARGPILRDPEENSLLCIVARGPVPRDLSTATKNARSREAADVFDRLGHGEAQDLALR